MKYVSPIVAFAQYIASSEAQFVMLLDFHDMPVILDMLAHKEAQDCLIEGGFTDYCSEADEEDSALYERLKRARIFSRATPNSAQSMREKLFSGQIPTKLKMRQIGFISTSAREVRDAAKEQLKRNELLVEKLMVNQML